MDSSEELLRKLDRDDLSDAELDHLYRELSKQTHPDLTGSDGTTFIQIRERYLEMKARKRAAQAAREGEGHGPQDGGHGSPEASDGTAEAAGAASAARAAEPAAEAQEEGPKDPLRVIRESGYQGELTARQCLYVALNRYYALGMYTHRMRAHAAADRRIQLVRATVHYWARRYDPYFSQIFSAYDQSYHVIVTDMSYRDRLFARRCFLQALEWFFKFQDRGRAGTGKIFLERAQWARAVLRRRGDEPQAAAMLGFVEWLLREYGSPPVMLKTLR